MYKEKSVDYTFYCFIYQPIMSLVYKRSAFIWICGSGGKKWREKQSLIFSFFFVGNCTFLKSEPKKVAFLLGLGADLKMFFFSWFLKDGPKSIWWFYCPGSGSALIKLCGSGSTSLFFSLGYGGPANQFGGGYQQAGQPAQATSFTNQAFNQQCVSSVCLFSSLYIWAGKYIMQNSRWGNK